MLGFNKAEKRNSLEDKYNTLRIAAKKAYKSGNFARYNVLVAQTNHLLVEMFSVNENTGTNIQP